MFCKAAVEFCAGCCRWIYAGSGKELNGDDAGPRLALDGDPGAAKGSPLVAG